MNLSETMHKNIQTFCFIRKIETDAYMENGKAFYKPKILMTTITKC